MNVLIALYGRHSVRATDSPGIISNSVREAIFDDSIFEKEQSRENRMW